MILDDGEKLFRVQVKTARLDGENAVIFNTVSLHPLTQEKTSYTGQVDAFVAYSPDTRKMYWVPIAEVEGSRFRLRLGKPRAGSRMAVDYQM